jgi:hypothetical protein
MAIIATLKALAIPSTACGGPGKIINPAPDTAAPAGPSKRASSNHPDKENRWRRKRKVKKPKARENPLREASADASQKGEVEENCFIEH